MLSWCYSIIIECRHGDIVLYNFVMVAISYGESPHDSSELIIQGIMIDKSYIALTILNHSPTLNNYSQSKAMVTI